MANVIKHKRGSGSDPAANNLVLGELAIRTDVGKLFTKMDSGAIAEIAGGGSDIAINTLSSSSATGGGSATFNGSAYRFTLSAPPSVSAQQLLVSINGVIQKPVAGTGQPSEGFAVDGTDIILGDAPATGADFFILTFKSLGVSEPADNSVTSAKIVDGAIVNADINASAAIAGSKIDPTFTSTVNVTNNLPEIFLTDSNSSNARARLNANGGGLLLGADNDNAHANSSISFEVDGSNKMFIDSSGNVGIGTTSPQNMIHTSAANDSSGIRMTNTYDTPDNVWALLPAISGVSNTGFCIRDVTDGVNRLVIDGSGNVGIGTTSPAKLLDVKGADGATVEQYLRNNTINLLSKINATQHAQFGTETSHDLCFLTGNGIRQTITAAGNVGIGTTSPSAKLQVSGGHINIDSGYSYQWGDSHERIEQSDGKIEFFTNNGEQMTLSGGNLGIGTTSPATRLHIEDTTPDLRIKSTNANLGQSDEVGRISIHTSDPTTPTGVGEVFRIKSFSANANGADYSTELTSRAGSGGGESAIRLGQGAVGAIAFRTNTSGDATERMRIDSSGNVGIGIDNQNNRLEIGTSSHYVVTNSGQARNGLHIRGQGGNSGEFGGAISFGCNNTGAAAIAAEQMSSDTDVVGLSFFTHESSTGSDDATKRVRIMQNGGIMLNNYGSTRGYIFQRLGAGTYPDFPNVQGSSGRGMCEGQRDVAANTATEIAKSHWGGLAVIGYSNSQHQGTAQVMFGYGGAGASVKFEGHWVRQESLTITFSMSLYSLRITHNASNDLSVWCVLIGV
nr:endosialidase [uncultured Mediterranean phage uvMED]BAR21516.1 endosialidase [uncultured Mediterranean phage uvMED]BAR21528.1 endosialidase [uncultured Mediterranean phage uvMED]BAR38653.1 endosialidase [uncultured Mediterranean phage uvMED]